MHDEIKIIFVVLIANGCSELSLSLRVFFSLKFCLLVIRGIMVEQIEEVNFAIPLELEDNTHSATTAQGSSNLMNDISLQV